MPLPTDNYWIAGWALYLILLAGVLAGCLLMIWAGLFFQVQIKRYDRSQANLDRARAQLKIAQERVDRAFEIAAKEIAGKAAGVHRP